MVKKWISSVGSCALGHDFCVLQVDVFALGTVDAQNLHKSAQTSYTIFELFLSHNIFLEIFSSTKKRRKSNSHR